MSFQTGVSVISIYINHNGRFYYYHYYFQIDIEMKFNKIINSSSGKRRKKETVRDIWDAVFV